MQLRFSLRVIWTNRKLDLLDNSILCIAQAICLVYHQFTGHCLTTIEEQLSK